MGLSDPIARLLPQDTIIKHPIVDKDTYSHLDKVAKYFDGVVEAIRVR